MCACEYVRVHMSVCVRARVCTYVYVRMKSLPAPAFGPVCVIQSLFWIQLGAEKADSSPQNQAGPLSPSRTSPHTTSPTRLVHAGIPPLPRPAAGLCRAGQGLLASSASLPPFPFLSPYLADHIQQARIGHALVLGVVQGIIPARARDRGRQGLGRLAYGREGAEAHGECPWGVCPCVPMSVCPCVPMCAHGECPHMGSV